MNVSIKVSIQRFILLGVASLMVAAHGQPATGLRLEPKNTATVETRLNDYQWRNRVLLIFSPDPATADLAQQLDHLSGMGAGLNARDLVVWKLINSDGSAFVNGNGEPSLSSHSFYQHFAVKDTDFTVILLGKDGTEKLRQRQPVTSRRLFSIIDAMPMRQREMRERGR